MIQQLSIRNFKSLRSLDLDCRRVNVLIGEPNAGKTNILEALALRSTSDVPYFREVLRAFSAMDLFPDQDVNSKITVTLDNLTIQFELDRDELAVSFLLSEKSDSVELNLGGMRVSLGSSQLHPLHRLTSQFKLASSSAPFKNVTGGQKILYYIFKALPEFKGDEVTYLSAPFGENLPQLLYSNKAARLSAAGFFHNSGYKLNVDVQEKQLKLIKQVDELLISHPYQACSETLRRMIFYSLALDTNQDQVLLFDEPEAHSFPPYTKTLAERIALDDRGNQFFLTTHSPYMLDSLLSKTPAKDLNVVLCRMEQFETKAYPLNQDQIDQIKEWSMDAFFNFDRLVPKAEKPE